MSTRILIADDHPLFRLALTQAVAGGAALGPVAVTEAGSLAEALAALAAAPDTDLVLLDLHLPDRDGDWVLRELGAPFPDLPVILLTADALAAQADWTSRGAAAVLTKPIDVPSLLEVVELALMERTS